VDGIGWYKGGVRSKHLRRPDYNDGQFFRAMEWLMVFFRPPLRSMVFNDFDNVGPSPLNVF